MSTNDARYSLDDAAAAALWRIRNAKRENIGLLYQDAGQMRATSAARGGRRRTGGAFTIPAGSLRGLYHNHPLSAGRGDVGDETRALFSPEDIEQAHRLGVPSYISAGESLYRYDPASRERMPTQPTAGEPVLAQIPFDVIVQNLMMRLLDREPTDPRGLYRETKSSSLPGLLADH